MYQAFILAAGLGTRLRPLTDHRPKPLVPVCGVPMLAYALAACRAAGLTEVVVNAHWLAPQIEAWRGVHEGVAVAVSTELPDVLGTGGGLRRVAAQLAPRFVVLNADVLCDVDLRALLAAVPDGGAAMVLRPAADAARYGVVAADATDTVVKLVEVAAASPVGEVRADTHFTGVHAMDVATLARVPDGFQCIVRTAYRELVTERRVRALRHAGTWVDVGDAALYLAANLAVLRGQVRTPIDVRARAAQFHGSDGWVGVPPKIDARGAVWVGHGAQFESDVRVEDSVIGDGALVSAGARLTRCVVWDGCRVPPGDHHDAIVFDGGILPVAS
jgi:mannose-1-phosphate guanylyltransferase